MTFLDIRARLWDNEIGVVAHTECTCAARQFRPLSEAAKDRYAQHMTLSDQQVQNFIECWQKDFAEVLTPDEARAEAMRLLDFFAALAEMLRHPRQSPSPSHSDSSNT